jgi:hypothetical protein
MINLDQKILAIVTNAGNISESNLLEKVQDVEVVPYKSFSKAINRLLNDSEINEHINFLPTETVGVLKMTKTYSIPIGTNK